MEYSSVSDITYVVSRYALVVKREVFESRRIVHGLISVVGPGFLFTGGQKPGWLKHVCYIWARSIYRE